MKAYIINAPLYIDPIVAIDLDTAALKVQEAARDIYAECDLTLATIKAEIVSTITEGDTRAYFFIWDDDFHSEKLTVDIYPIVTAGGTAIERA